MNAIETDPPPIGAAHLSARVSLALLIAIEEIRSCARSLNIHYDDSEITEPRSEPNDLRDSGISTASLLDFQSHLNNLGYEDFEPRSRCNDIMNISPPTVISALNVSTGSFASGTFQGSHSLSGQEVRN
jgi:dedicator of cytokinesis protein 3